MMSSFLIQALLLLCFYPAAHSFCSKNCVHFEGAHSVSLQKTDSFCKGGFYDGRKYYAFESTTASKKFLYFETLDDSWKVASRLGSKQVDALVSDLAADPTDISSTWKIGLSGYQSYTYHGYSNRASVQNAQFNYDMEVKCGKYDDRAVTVGVSVGAVVGSIILACLISVCLYKLRQRRLLALRRDIMARSVREYMFVSLLAARRRENRHAATVLTHPASPPSYEDSAQINPDLPPPYQESINADPPSYSSSNPASVSNHRTFSDHTATGAGTVNDTASSSVITTVSGHLATSRVTDETTRNLSAVSDGASCHPSHRGSSYGNDLQPLRARTESPKDGKIGNTDPVFAVGVSEDEGTGTSDSDTQLLIV